MPADPLISQGMNDFLQYLLSVANKVEGSLFPPPTPSVATISHPSAVQVIWNEVGGAASYAIFETSTNSIPAGVPLTTVPANLGGTSNSFLRSSLNDTTIRYYWVQAFDRDGNRSAISQPASGAALSSAAPVIPVSQTPVSQPGTPGGSNTGQTGGLVGGGVGGGGALPGVGTKINRLFQ